MGERKKVGKAVLDRLGPFTPGSTAERLIEKPSFYEINSATGLTVYCECEFHDTKEGSEFIIKNTKIIGEAIAKGICDYYGISVLDEEKTEEKKKTHYTVQVGAFSSKNNAIKYAEKIKKAGFDAIVVSK
jgi:N-acetylmuramoyl-L-alanine amidase